MRNVKNDKKGVKAYIDFHTHEMNTPIQWVQTSFSPWCRGPRCRGPRCRGPGCCGDRRWRICRRRRRPPRGWRICRGRWRAICGSRTRPPRGFWPRRPRRSSSWFRSRPTRWFRPRRTRGWLGSRRPGRRNAGKVLKETLPVSVVLSEDIANFRNLDAFSVSLPCNSAKDALDLILDPLLLLVLSFDCRRSSSRNIRSIHNRKRGCDKDQRRHPEEGGCPMHRYCCLLLFN